MSTQPSPQVAALLPKLASLEQALLDGDPKMPVHLKEIHKLLISYEELAHLLSEEQIAVLLSAQGRRVGVLLAEEGKKAEKKASNKRIGADDL
jgi:hypothetical protein